MTSTLIKECWNVIRQKDKTLMPTGYHPLASIDDYLSYFGLPILTDPNIKPDVLADINSENPSFKTLTDDIILSLRYHIYTQKKLEVVDKWAERLLRFCEIRSSTLKKRSINKCKTKAAAQLHILHLASLFLDHSINTKDLRFLNTVLKLSDLKWVLNKKTALDFLNKKKSGLNSALFQFRIILTTEYAINKLQKEKTDE